MSINNSIITKATESNTATHNVEFYSNPEFGKIRTLLYNNIPYFVGKDIADALGYRNGSRDVNRHVDDEDKIKTMIFDGKQNKETIIINESGMYSLILSSKLPTAKQFKHWVTSEVLPSIEKHGTYMTQQTIDDIVANPKNFLRLVAELDKERELKEKALKEQRKLSDRIDEQKPLVDFANDFKEADKLFPIDDLAKKLVERGFKGINQNKMFELLRNDGFLIKQKGDKWNHPTMPAAKKGLFTLRCKTVTTPYGTKIKSYTPKLTAKGIEFLLDYYTKKLSK